MRIRSFRNEKKNQFYFRVFDTNEDQILRSEAYEAKAGRDNGIESFKKNAPIAERYERLTSADGKYYFNVKAANHQIVATSLLFDTEEKREQVIAEIIAYATNATAPQSVISDIQNLSASTPPNSPEQNNQNEKEQDDYQEFSFYESSGTSTTSGFDRFQKGEHNYYYFSFKSDDGKLLLISQGYKAEAGRDNGIASVEKNAPIENRYVHHSTDDGKYFFTLKAGNHQEIARSTDFDSEAIMLRAIGILMNGEGSLIDAEMTRAMNQGDGKELDDYMDLDFYQNSATGVASGFDRFQKGEHNFFYFSFLTNDGQVILISQGYKAEAGRDNGIASVEKNAPIEKRYVHHSTDDGKYFFTLKAGNHQEIARSADFDSEAIMLKAIGILMNGEGSLVDTEMTKAMSHGDGKALDDYMDLDFYQNSATGVTSGFDRFQKGEHNFHYFSFLSDDGQVILISQGYKAEAGRDNGIASVEKNGKLEERYNFHTTDDGKHFFTLKAGNHQEIARSVTFDTEENMKKAFLILMNGGGAMVAAENVKAVPKSITKDLDDYRTFGFYKESGTDVQNGWDRFYSDHHNEYYFSYKVDGEPMLISEGYTSEAARENGIASVEKNWGIEKRYKHHETPGGRYYFTIKAGNHQEITRSKWYSSAEERDQGMAWLLAGGLASGTMNNLAATTIPAVDTTISSTNIIKDEVRPEAVEDDYLACEEYENHEVNDKINNVAFFKHENGQFYFVVYKSDGTVRLRSEGFETAKNRDLELSGVLKNLENEEMYEVKEKGKYRMYILKDKDGREVGRSCLETIEEKAAPPIIETVAASALAATAAAEIEPEVPAEKNPPVTKDVEDDYLNCKAYAGHEIVDTVNNVAFFTHENGQFYFVVYKEDGSVRLRSEGFRDTEARDRELAGVLKHMDNPDMYETENNGKYRIHILKNEQGKEVGRSCIEIIEEKTAIPPVVEATAVAAAAIAAVDPIPEPEVEVKTELDVEDDYLHCKEYQNHTITDEENKVAYFTHSDGQYYFVIYKSDGTVRLRSEGFKTTQDRDDELASALKHLDNPEMYETKTNGKYSLHILKDETGREVGRSCVETDSNPVAVPIIAAATTAAAAALASTDDVPPPPIQVEEEIITPVPPPVVEKPMEKVPPVVVAAAESGGGGFNWKWLLLLPLLLALLFWKGCFECNKPTPPPANPTSNIPTTPTDDNDEKEVVNNDPADNPTKNAGTSETKPAPVAPPPVSCNCTGSNNIIFNIPTNKTPKALTVLGRNPEFGNSHEVDPTGFYNKLKNAHATNARDKRFLDDLFKAMGYTNGFADAQPNQFSETTLVPGTVGNMGEDKKHRTKYAVLNTKGKDLEAFKIKAANGCDIHFMKTCGNHFFFCPK